MAGVAGTAGVAAWLDRRSVVAAGNVLGSTVGSAASFVGSVSFAGVG
ncbi:MAG: hypothetical protein AB7O66_10760 [Limisphaerales bacterium]